MKRYRRNRRFEIVEDRLLLTTATDLPVVSVGDLQQVELYEPNGSIRVIAGEYADLNNDGMGDYVVATNPSFGSERHVRILHSDAEGNPIEVESHRINGDVVDVIAIDLDNSGFLDVVVATNTHVHTFVRTPTVDEASFQTLDNEFAVPGLSSIAVVDVNGDDIPDLAIGTNSQVKVLTGTGDGTFGSEIVYLEQAGQKIVVAHDLDVDGDLDLAVANREFMSASVLLNDGAGIFESGMTVSDVGPARTAFIANVDADEHADLLVGSFEQEGHNLRIFRGVGDGTFVDSPNLHETVGSPIDIKVDDVNQDGFADVIVGHDSTFHHPITNNGPGGVSLFLGRAESLLPAVRVRTPGASDIIVVDGGDDEFPQIASFDAWQNTVSLFRWEAQSIITEGTDYSEPFEAFAWKATTIGDFNGDGLSDVVVSDRWREGASANVYLANEDGTREVLPLALPSDRMFSDLYTGDFNGDGLDDLAVGVSDDRGVARIGILTSTGNGEFAALDILTYSPIVNEITDFTGNGRDEILGVSGESIILLHQSDDGNWTRESTPLPSSVFVSNLRVSDLNNDGNNDVLAVYNEGIQISYGDGNGGFEDPLNTRANTSVASIGDLNGDGHLDVIGRTFSDPDFSVYWGSETGEFESVTLTGLPETFEILLFDVDVDGADDVVIVDQSGFNTYAWASDSLQHQGYTNISFRPGALRNVNTDGDSDMELVIGPPQAFISSDPAAKIAVLDRMNGELAAPILFATPAVDATIAEITTGDDLEITLLHRSGFSVLRGEIPLPIDIDTVCRVSQQSEHSQAELDAYDQNMDGIINEDDVEHFIVDVHQSLRGDLDMDGDVDFSDFLILALNYNAVDAGYSEGDVDCNGEVGFTDFLALATNFGKSVDE